ncbi:MAG: methyltransferase domain-containing protein [Desulfobulbaceae bacterium]|nr:MAG: methyltransferase domain-containing protein [Desulfobulbaceae bacterium]
MDRERSSSRNNLAFLHAFLRSPEKVASIVPSSRFLERRLIKCAGISQAGLVVELGPGSGGTTFAILNAMKPTARLLSIEITPEFVELLTKSHDSRLNVHLGSAEHIRDILVRYDFGAPDVVVSGIPFSTMSPALGRRVIGEVWASLAPGGMFVAYQVWDRVAVLGRELLGKPEIELELLNVPPMRLFCWRKPGAKPRDVHHAAID